MEMHTSPFTVVSRLKSSMVKFFIEFLCAVKIYFGTNFVRIHTRMPDIPVHHIILEHAHPADKWGVDGILLPALPVERGIGSAPGGELHIETHRPVQARAAVDIRRASMRLHLAGSLIFKEI
jgi:hypothetical protein